MKIVGENAEADVSRKGLSIEVAVESQVLYVIRDNIAEKNSPLFSAPTRGVAVRQFNEMVEKVPSRKPGDFCLLLYRDIQGEPMLMEVLDEK